MTNKEPRLSLNNSLIDGSETITNKKFSDNLTGLDDESGSQERKIVHNNEDKQEDNTPEDEPCSPIIKKTEKIKYEIFNFQLWRSITGSY